MRHELRRARLFHARIPLRRGYAVAYESYDSVENAVLALECSCGLAGWGSAAPDEHVTGETLAASIAALRREIIPALLSRKETDFAGLLTAASAAAPHAPAARAAADIALHDLHAKHNGISIAGWLGAVRRAIPTSMTIGICGIEETIAQAEEYAGQGFGILKIKGGHDPAEDIARILAVREALGPGVAIRLDPNQGYTPAQAREVAARLAGILEFIEQPVPADDIEGLAALAASAPVPVMADEAMISLSDAEELFRRGVKLVNIKMMKCGGIGPALEICRSAHSHGVAAMIGCMDELPASMAAAAAVALSQPAVKYADLDGHLDLDQAAITGGLEISGGEVSAIDAPGLGLVIDENVITGWEIPLE